MFYLFVILFILTHWLMNHHPADKRKMSRVSPHSVASCLEGIYRRDLPHWALISMEGRHTDTAEHKKSVPQHT